MNLKGSERLRLAYGTIRSVSAMGCDKDHRQPNGNNDLDDHAWTTVACIVANIAKTIGQHRHDHCEERPAPPPRRLIWPAEESGTGHGSVKHPFSADTSRVPNNRQTGCRALSVRYREEWTSLAS